MLCKLCSINLNAYSRVERIFPETSHCNIRVVALLLDGIDMTAMFVLIVVRHIYTLRICVFCWNCLSIWPNV